MKKHLSLIVLTVIILIATSACDRLTTETSGTLAKNKVTITAHDMKGNIVKAVGDTVTTRGDITVVDPANSSLVELYSNGQSWEYVAQGVWGPSSVIGNFPTRAALWKDSNRINGLKYKLRSTNGIGVETMDLDFDLNYTNDAEQNIVQPLNKVYQAKTDPNEDGLTLYLGNYNGIKWSGTTETFVPYGTHYQSQEMVMTVYWTGIADSTGNGVNGLIPNPVHNMVETLVPGMNMWLKSSFNDMEFQPMVYNSQYNTYSAQIKILASIPTAEIFQNIAVVELPNWSVKRYGVNVAVGGLTTELINVFDYDPSGSEWPIFLFKMIGNRPCNVNWFDTRNDFIFTDIIPH